MLTRAFQSCLLFLWASVLIAAVGCSKAPTAPGASNDDEIRQALKAPLQQLEAGHPESALASLLGRKIDAAAWKRTEKSLTARLARNAQAGVAACSENLAALANAIELYRADEANGYRMPDKLKDIIGLNGVTAIPTCPTAGKDTYSSGYTPDFRNETFVLACKGHSHKAAALRADQPRWDPRFGIVARTESATSWWPAAYRAEISSMERSGDTATVSIQERNSGAVTLNLKKVEGAWVIDGDSFADDGKTTLGMMVSSYLSAATAGAPPVPVDRAQCVRRLGRLATALEGWSSDHGGRYPSRLDDLVPAYLPDLPLCSGEVEPHYQLSPGGASYELSCAGQHPDVHLTNRTSGVRIDRRVSHNR